MFLFSSFDNSNDVGSALRNASRRTGANFDYLKTTAQRESNLDPTAKAKSSSATGLFQFVENTWLSMLKKAGPEHGYSDLAKQITPTAGGGYKVANASARKEILELREDPKAAALMAGEFTMRNAEELSRSLGRQATEGELYAAHFLGAQGAVEMVRLAETAPNAPAAERFPAAAAANRSIFYQSGGAPRSASEVYGILVSGYDATGYDATPAIPENARYLAFAPGRASEDHVFHGMYRSEGQGLGPIGNAVASFWSNFAGTTSAYGFASTPEVAKVETDPSTGEVVLRTQAGDRDVQGMTERVESTTREARVRTGYGRFGDDPSLLVR